MRSKEIFIVSLFLFLLSIVFSFPAILSLPIQVIGDGGDNLQFLSFQYVGNMLFSQGNFPFEETNFWRYPVGISFQSSYDSTLLILLGLIFYSFTQNGVLVYNLSLFVIFFLNAILSYLTFRRFFPSLISLIGTIIYGFSFYSLARLLGHPIFCFLQLSPSFSFLSLTFQKKKQKEALSFLYCLLF